jgi:GTPase SAR1 family protein
LSPPFRIILAGGSGSGKSSYLLKLLRNLNLCVDRTARFDSVRIYYQILNQDLVDLMTESETGLITLRKGTPTREELDALGEDDEGRKTTTLWVIEDALSEIRNSKLTTEIMTRVSSHCGLSVCMTLQVRARGSLVADFCSI